MHRRHEHLAAQRHWDVLRAAMPHANAASVRSSRQATGDREEGGPLQDMLKAACNKCCGCLNAAASGVLSVVSGVLSVVVLWKHTQSGEHEWLVNLMLLAALGTTLCTFIGWYERSWARAGQACAVASVFTLPVVVGYLVVPLDDCASRVPVPSPTECRALDWEVSAGALLTAAQILNALCLQWAIERAICAPPALPSVELAPPETVDTATITSEEL
eukprot:TRINITY_DN13692_c0_g1_i1.p2 TRINITY_DN13692_c0_g1~~TRINITY_DN13692_c0_g1_i1.p2  ORF type:complete len:217 (+),score=31.37 TRINITY_DN13692_c0_g1_i1:377-1027(+)